MDDVQAVGKLTAACPEYKAATSLHQSACNRAWGTSLDAGFGQVDPAAQPVIDNQHPLHLSAGQAGQPLRNPQTAIQTRGQHGLVHLRTVDETTVLQCRPEGITSSRPVPSSPYKQPVHHLPGLPNRSRIKLSFRPGVRQQAEAHRSFRADFRLAVLAVHAILSKRLYGNDQPVAPHAPTTKTFPWPRQH